MKIRIASTDFKNAQKLAATLSQKGYSLAEKESEADLIFTLYDGEVPALPACGVPGFDPQQVDVTRALLRTALAVQDIDMLAAAYKQSGSAAPVVHAGATADLVAAYLYKKHGILSYALAPEAAGIGAALTKDTGVSADGLKIKFAGVKGMLWVYEATDGTGKDICPALRAAVKGEKLDVSRFMLTLEPKKSLAFYGYYHSAKAIKADRIEEAVKLADALTAASETTLPLFAVNTSYIYGLDEVPVCLPCAVGGGRIVPGKAELPLQCVLASNDYAGALLTAANALAKRCPDVYKRAVKLDPCVASVLTLDEADRFAEDALAANKEAAVFFGR